MSPNDRVGTPSRFHAAGLALVASPLAGLIGSLLLPTYTEGMRGELAFIAEHRARWLAGMSCDLLFTLLLIPASLAMMSLLRRRGSRVGAVAAAMLVVAAFVHGVMLGYQLPEASIVAHAADRAQAVSLAESMYGDPAFTMLVIPFTALLFPGLLLLAWSLWRSRATPPWASLAIVAAVVVEIAGPPAWKARAMFALLLIGLGWVGMRLLRSAAGAEPRDASPRDDASAATAAAAAPSAAG